MRHTPDSHTTDATADTRRSGFARRGFRLLTDMHALSIADQAVISGTSFLVTVLVAHFGGPAQVGIYAIGLSVVAILIAVQEALIVLPYAIHQHSSETSPAEHAGAALALNGALSLVIAFALSAGALVVYLSNPGSDVLPITAVVIGIFPLVLMREFLRRYALAHFRVGQALCFDVATTALQIAALFAVGWFGWMSASLALICLGGACAISLVWLFTVRSEFAFALRSCSVTLRRSWMLGRWLLASRVAGQVQGYFTHWLTLLMAGAAVTGVYTACLSIAAFANPLVFGLGNILTPKAARAWKDGGGSGLLNQALKDALLFAVIMTAFVGAVALFGERAMQLIYRGKDFAGHAELLTLLAIATTISSLGMPASTALATMERPRAIVIVTIIGALVSAALVFLFIREWGLVGAGYGLVAGTAVGSAGRWVAFVSLVSRQSDAAERASLRLAIAALNPELPAGEYQIARLGQGDDATAYLVRSASADGILPGHAELVFKLYKTNADLTLDELHRQFSAQRELHEAVQERSVNGWTISVAQPLAVVTQPLAMGMTKVPGGSFESFCDGDSSHQDDMRSAAGALARTMDRLWARGISHRDFGLRNVLFDRPSRTISLIDAGTHRSCPACGSSELRCSAAARDIGHLIYEHVTDVGDLFGSRNRGDRQTFIETTLHEAVALGDSDTLPDEIGRSVFAHLDKALAPGLSLRGIWHALVYRVAAHKVRLMMDQLNRRKISGSEEHDDARVAAYERWKAAT